MKELLERLVSEQTKVVHQSLVRRDSQREFAKNPIDHALRAITTLQLIVMIHKRLPKQHHATRDLSNEAARSLREMIGYIITNGDCDDTGLWIEIELMTFREIFEEIELNEDSDNEFALLVLEVLQHQQERTRAELNYQEYRHALSLQIVERELAATKFVLLTMCEELWPEMTLDTIAEVLYPEHPANKLMYLGKSMLALLALIMDQQEELLKVDEVAVHAIIEHAAHITNRFNPASLKEKFEA